MFRGSFYPGPLDFRRLCASGVETAGGHSVVNRSIGSEPNPRGDSAGE